MVYIVLSLLISWGLHFLNPILGIGSAVFLFFLLLMKKKKNISFLFLLFFTLLVLKNIEDQKWKDSSVAAISFVEKAKENYVILNCNGKRYYCSYQNNSLENYDIIYIEGTVKEISFSSLEGEFDFETYLKNQSIYYEIFPSKIERKFPSLCPLKKWKTYFFQGINQNAYALFDTLFFNENTEISKESYLIGIGMLFSINGYFLTAFLHWIDKIKKRFFGEKYPYFSNLICFPILLFSQFKIGVVRAFIYDWNQKKKGKKWEKNVINSFFLLFLLLRNPNYLLLDVFDYLFFIPFLLNFTKNAMKSLPQFCKNGVSNFFTYEVFLCFMVIQKKSISPFSFFLLPIFLYVFKRIYFLSYFFLFFPTKDFPFNFLGDFIHQVILFLPKFLPLFFIESPILFCILFLLFSFFFLLFLEKKDFKKGSVFAIFLFFSSVFCSNQFLLKKDAYVAFLNVGQGDCALIHSYDTDILIDTGGLAYKDVASDVLIPFFQKKGIKDIDLIFLSHNDFDHSGALESLERQFPVKKVILGNQFDSIREQDFLFTNYNHFSYDGYGNDQSSVIYFRFFSKTFLFTGDISSEIERQLINHYDLQTDILKVAHHGSNTSSCEEFLKATHPSEAVISCGKNNFYHHPSNEVLKRLEKLNISIRRTDLEGTIYYKENSSWHFFLSSYFEERKKKESGSPSENFVLSF